MTHGAAWPPDDVHVGVRMLSVGEFGGSFPLTPAAVAVILTGGGWCVHRPPPRTAALAPSLTRIRSPWHDRLPAPAEHRRPDGRRTRPQSADPGHLARTGARGRALGVAVPGRHRPAV